jgi:hypothetical protein
VIDYGMLHFERKLIFTRQNKQELEKRSILSQPIPRRGEKLAVKRFYHAIQNAEAKRHQLAAILLFTPLSREG